MIIFFHILSQEDKDGNFLFEDVGTFEKNKSDGKGIFRNAEITYKAILIGGNSTV